MKRSTNYVRCSIGRVGYIFVPTRKGVGQTGILMLVIDNQVDYIDKISLVTFLANCAPLAVDVIHVRISCPTIQMLWEAERFEGHCTRFESWQAPEINVALWDKKEVTK